ncbi:MAG: GTPase ObgE [Christensenellaceae bacterium]|jgi:GTP-binding protein|nr:GTPase ObgE [Christensenellaceae bacterium]
MFLDTATIYVKPGNGGNGIVSFHREKYVQNGGPDGGNGGNGGSIIFIGDKSINTLSQFRFAPKFCAENGGNGEKKKMTGKSGSDLKIRVPCGTIVKDFASGGILADIFHPDIPVNVLLGGKGGKGNSQFATAIRKAPGFSELGVVTKERKLILELKTIADVGLVGFPNAGKSTLLSVISAAHPKIADYPFTTLTPNLGVVSIDDYSYVVADIPGLIEGAADGNGLGHDFLRHIERVKLIVHLLDVGNPDLQNPIENYLTIRRELMRYSESLANLPEIIVANKIDLLSDQSILHVYAEAFDDIVVPISAATTEGITALKRIIASKLKNLPPVKQFEFKPFTYKEIDKTDVTVERETEDSFRISGGMMDEYSRKVVLSDDESFRWFQRSLRDNGVIEKLKDIGLKQGDTIKILDVEFIYEG